MHSMSAKFIDFLVCFKGVEIYTQNGTLHLEGLTAEYQIYNMSGQMVYSGNVSTLDLAKGIYIIRIADKSQKIVL